MLDQVKSEKDNLIINPKRIALLLFSIVGLGLVFLSQGFDIVLFVLQSQLHPNIHFVVKKAIRVLLNDSFMLLFIYAWFYKKSITQMAWRLQLIDTCILFPLYLLLKLSLEGVDEISSPLLSQLHRLIVNPTIMILLIPGVYFQRIMQKPTL